MPHRRGRYPHAGSLQPGQDDGTDPYLRLIASLDILPRPKGRGFLLDGDVFMLGMNTMARGPYATSWHGLRAAKSRENVDRGVDVAIMMGSAIGTRPFSDTQPCSTFRTAAGNVSTA